MKELYSLNIDKNKVALAINEYGLDAVIDIIKKEIETFITKSLIEINNDKKLKRNTELLKRMYQV